MDIGKLKVGIQSLLGYLPATVIKNILDGQIDSKILPSYYKIKTVSLFADISGFTKLSETFAKKGRAGPEFLAFTLNRYMEQLINIISKNGGDIFKFAGDAILVIWPQTDNIEESCYRAIQCALDIQNKLNNVEISPGKYLSVKIGIGVGECMILVVGGQFMRCEYLCVGEALAKACMAETKALCGGETICSEQVINYVGNSFLYEETSGENIHGEVEEGEKFYRIKRMTGERIQAKSDAYLIRTKFNNEKLREKAPILKSFVPAAIVKYLDIEKESWSKEIRMLTIMFLNLKVDLSQTRTDEGIQRIQSIVKTVQRCVYRTRGALNKFLMDDKGSVMLICWGIPPISSQDDHIRGVQSGFLLSQELKKFNCEAYMGLTTGSCFTGVCGTIGGRREYSLLGEIVNLSARHMQKAIYYSLEIAQKKKVNYLMLIDERTKNLIQNKIFSKYLCEDYLKGFQNKFSFFEPKIDKPDKYNYNFSMFPEIRTHKDNIPIYDLPPNATNEWKTFYDKSLFMIGRNKELTSFIDKVIGTITNYNKELILVRGLYGSGKSLFIRRGLNEIVSQFSNLKTNSFSFKKIFVSFQTPISFYDPMNGWRQIFQKIFNSIKNDFFEKKILQKQEFPFTYGLEKIGIQCDLIGRMLFKSSSYSYIRFIEEILNVSLNDHFVTPEDPVFNRIYQIKQLEERDCYFQARKCDKYEKHICNFFAKLLKAYQKLISEKELNPLIFIIEDCHLIDDLSIQMIKILKEKSIKGISIICSYQDPISPLIKSQNSFLKHDNLFDPENEYLMDNLTDYEDVADLLMNNLEKNFNIEKINHKLTNILLTKSFKGNPLFLIDIFENLLNSNSLIEIRGKEATLSQELREIVENNDWIDFRIPLRIEKIIGSILDNLDVKEIILLKHAAVIGNFFDIDKLNRMNPFDNILFDDLYAIIQNLETNGIVEIMYDLNPKQLICKFAIPFMREICYQRMLIEQKMDIHLLAAKLMQNVKFSYIPHQKEMYNLKKHLRFTEKSMINYIEEECNEATSFINHQPLNKNNLKLVIVKNICEKLKLIHLRMDDQIMRMNPVIKSGILNKKSSKNITWTNRYFILTNKKVIYWSDEITYRNNQLPLGWFFLKHIFQVQGLPDYSKGGKANVFKVHVATWFKRDREKSSRKFYFSVKKKDEIYTWIITLNFLRVKEIYNDFTMQFGTIQLPLNHELKRKIKKRIKQKFHHPQNVFPSSNKNHINFYKLSSRKSIDNISHSMISEKKMRRHTNFLTLASSEIYNEENDLDKKVNKLKDNISNVFNIGLLGILGYIQDIIFNIDDIGNFDEKIIKFPENLLEDNRFNLSKSFGSHHSYYTKMDKNGNFTKVNIIKEEKEDIEDEEQTYDQKLLETEEYKETDNKVLTTFYRATDNNIHFLSSEKIEENEYRSNAKNRKCLEEEKMEVQNKNISIELSNIKSDSNSNNEFYDDVDEIFGSFREIKNKVHKFHFKKPSLRSDNIEINNENKSQSNDDKS